MPKKYKLVLFFIFFFTKSWCQTLQFDVLVDGVVKGKMQVSRSTFVNNKSIIDINISFSVAAVGTSKIEQYSTSYFKKNMLTNAESVLERNDRIKEQCIITLKGNAYQIERKNENPLIFSSLILFTVSDLYYTEPKSQTKVFSERYGELCNVKSLGSGIYEVEWPVGGGLKYFYKNGKCFKTESSGNLQSLTMILKAK